MKYILIILIFSGCASNHLVPKTTIMVRDEQGKRLDIELPKDMKAGSVEISKTQDGLRLFISNIEVRTNPEVISTAGDAQQQVIDRLSQSVENLSVIAAKAFIPAP